ncbi:MAG TPA: hypothetical protein VLE94_00765 [Burkholderiaceae bacterium]|nr:hypothetical protein [Burkholderiaceae bacterium]
MGALTVPSLAPGPSLLFVSLGTAGAGELVAAFVLAFVGVGAASAAGAPMDGVVVGGLDDCA